MQIVLLAAGVISIYPVKQPGTGIMILLLTLLNAVLGLNQEGKAAAAVAALAKMMIVKARVRRDGALALLPAEQLVPGRRRRDRGRRRRARRRARAGGGDAGGGRGGADRREPAGGQGRRRRRGAGRAARRPHRHGLHEHERDARHRASSWSRRPGMATEVGHISGMLQRQDESKSPLTLQLEKLTKQLVTIAGLALVASVVLNMARGQSVHRGLHRGRGVRDRRDPDRPARRGDHDPLARHAAAGRRQRDRQAAALDRDARRDLGDLLGQDRHADAQPDDRGRADDPRPPLHGLRQRLLDRGPDQARRRRAGGRRSSRSCSRSRWPATRCSPTPAR